MRHLRHIILCISLTLLCAPHIVAQEQRDVLRILAIGNSFSDDGMEYLPALLDNLEVEDVELARLYVGGCSLERHLNYHLKDEAPYVFNHSEAGKNRWVQHKEHYSLRRALDEGEWDIITLQQASHDSARFATYEPYLETIVSYVKKYCPTAKILVHQTWAYENGSTKLANQGFATDEEMFAQVEKAYEKAREMISADGLIQKFVFTPI